MFAIYDQFAVKFRDNLDELNKIIPVLQTDNIASNTTKSFEKALHDTKNDYQNNSNEKQPYHTKEAINTYKQIAKINYNEEIHHVHQLMTKKVITAYENDTILHAIKLMNEHNISQIPIIKDDNLIGGMLNKDDILKLLIDNFVYELKIMDTIANNQILNNQISSILDYFIITTDPITDIRRVAKVMHKYHLNALAVVNENGRLEGIVSKSDIVKIVSNEPHYQMWS